MDIGHIITMAVVIVLMVLLMVVAMELLIPIQLKFEMNGLCRSYIYKIEGNGGLNDEEKDQLKKALIKIGLSEPEIKIESDGNRFGDKVHVFISGLYKSKRMVSLFNRQDESLKMVYERSYHVRKITN